MRYKVIIYQENCDKIEFEDDDNLNASEYVLKMSNILKNDSVNILELSNNKNIIIRPSKIISIVVDSISTYEKEECIVEE